MLLVVVLKQQKLQSNLVNKINSTKSVSIVICAKNEAENLQRNLPFFIAQQHPNFEIIIVDDGSKDNTPLVLETFVSNNTTIRVIKINPADKIGYGKKYALQLGIEAAKNELIYLTDTDCKPASEHLLTIMTSAVSDKYKIVLGVSPYYKTNGILNGLIEYETTQTALQYLGFALLDYPYMSVGRNVLYDAKLLKTLQWSKEDYAIASGDDDLAIQQLSNNENTTVCIDKDSFTFSEANKTWRTWIAQKLRHYQTGARYRIKQQFLLGTYLATKLVLYLSIFCLSINSISIFATKFNTTSFIENVVLFLAFIGLYAIPYQLLNMLILFLLSKKTEISIDWKFSPFYDILYALFTTMLGFISSIKPTRKWK